MVNTRLVVTLLCGVSMAGSVAPPIVGAAEQPSEGTVILSAASTWRYSIACRRPVMRKDQRKDQRLVEMKGTFVNTAWPAADWFAPDFDDHLWIRLRGPFFRTTHGHAYVPAVDGKGYTSYEQGGPGMALLCARARFAVTDPGTVGDLALSLAYRGGAIIYLNGKEVARGHLPDADRKGFETLAEEYGDEVCLDAEGRLITIGPSATENADRLEKRIRRLAGTRIPTAGLRRRANVLAVEIHRAPYPKAILKSVAAHDVQTFDWVPMGLVSLEMRAAGPGAVPNVGRPKGLQV